MASSTNLETILQKLLLPDNNAIQQATQELKTAFGKPAVYQELVSVLNTSQEPTVRQYASILIRRRVVKQWSNLPDDIKQSLKVVALQAVAQEPIPFVRASICEVIGSIGKHELPLNSWPVLLQTISLLAQDGDAAKRELGYQMLCSLCSSAAEQLQPFYKDLFPAFAKGLTDTKQSAFLCIKSLTSLVNYFGTEEEALLKPMLSGILEIVKSLLAEDEDRACEALDLFDELTQIEVAILSPYVRPLLQFCMQVLGSEELSDPLKTKALHLICWACRRKGKTLVKANLLGPLLQLLLKTMSLEEEDEEDEEHEAGAETATEMNSLSSVAGQALDLLALHLAPDKLIPQLMELLQKMFPSPNPHERKAAYIALGELAEGCADYIRNKYLEEAVMTAMKGLQDPSSVVRNAALFLLGQLSEHVQPEVGKYHGVVIPTLVAFLSTVSNDPQADANHKGTLTKLFYAIEKFLEGLDKEVVEIYIAQLMEAFIYVLQNSKSSHSSELGISAIGALVTSAKESLANYFGMIMEQLKVFFQQPITDETSNLHAQAVDTLGCLARNIGNDLFYPVADECMQFGIRLIEDSDDPDLRRCTYGLFASVAVVFKENMQQYLPKILPKMIASLQSTEGFVATYDTKDPAFLIDGDVDDIEDLTTMKDEDEEAEEEDIGFSVENAYMEEKEDTINSFCEIAENIGAPVAEHLSEFFKEIFLLTEFPQSNVRKASITGSCRLCTIFYKLAQAQGNDVSSAQEHVMQVLPVAMGLIKQDDDRYVAIATVEALQDLFTCMKGDVFVHEDHVTEMSSTLMTLLQGKTFCQELDEDEHSSTDASGQEEDTQAELDQMLIEKTGDLIPLFAQSIGGDLFKPHFSQYIPELTKRMKKSCSVSERSFAAGTIAETIQAMGLSIGEFVPVLTPLLMMQCADADEEVRSNSCFALGVLVEHGKQFVNSFHQSILQAFGQLLDTNQPTLVRDNIGGALARYINTARQLDNYDAGLQWVLPMMMKCVPIKEDKRENNTVTSCLTQLYAADLPVLMPYMENVLLSLINSLKDTESGLEKETRMNVLQVLKDIESKYGDAYRTCLDKLQLPHTFLNMMQMQMMVS